MSMLGMNGFEMQNAVDDGLIVLLGSAAYTTTLPPGSASARSVNVRGDRLESPWIDGVQTGSRKEPSGNRYWFQAFYRTALNGTRNDNNRIGTSRNGLESMVLSFEDNTNKVTLRVAGTVRATAVSFAVSTNTFCRLTMDVIQADGSDVNVYADGDLANAILTYTLTATDISNLAGKANGFFMEGDTITDTFIDDVFAMDPLDGVGVTNIQLIANKTVKPIPFTGDSPTYAQWAGTFADIDELPISDADDISTSTVDDASTFTHSGATEGDVSFCQTKWRTTRGDTSAGQNLQIRIRNGVTDKDETITSAPAAGNIIQHHQTAADGTAWDQTKFNPTEFGPVART